MRAKMGLTRSVTTSALIFSRTAGALVTHAVADPPVTTTIARPLAPVGARADF